MQNKMNKHVYKLKFGLKFVRLKDKISKYYKHMLPIIKVITVNIMNCDK